MSPEYEIRSIKVKTVYVDFRFFIFFLLYTARYATNFIIILSYKYKRVLLKPAFEFLVLAAL